jgi:hypothetical protein
MLPMMEPKVKEEKQRPPLMTTTNLLLTRISGMEFGSRRRGYLKLDEHKRLFTLNLRSQPP